MKKITIYSIAFIIAVGAGFFFLKKTVAQSSQQQEKITLHLTSEEVNYILNSLADKPYKETASLINTIIGQLQTPAVKPVAPAKTDSTNKDSKHKN